MKKIYHERYDSISNCYVSSSVRWDFDLTEKVLSYYFYNFRPKKLKFNCLRVTISDHSNLNYLSTAFEVNAITELVLSFKDNFTKFDKVFEIVKNEKIKLLVIKNHYTSKMRLNTTNFFVSYHKLLFGKSWNIWNCVDSH